MDDRVVSELLDAVQREGLRLIAVDGRLRLEGAQAPPPLARLAVYGLDEPHTPDA